MITKYLINISKYLVFFLIISLLNNCIAMDDDKEPDSSIIIVNDLNNYKLYFIGETTSSINDTLQTFGCIPLNSEVVVNPMNSFELEGVFIEEVFKEGKFLQLFLYEEVLLTNYSCDEIVNNNLYSARYSLDLQKIQDLNWRIEYP